MNPTDQKIPNTPVNTSENIANKKRELSSPFSPEDKITKKTKSGMSGSESGADMDTSVDPEAELLSQTHMLTLPDSELQKLSQLVIPSVQSDTLAAVRSDLKSLIKESLSEVLDDKLSELWTENNRLSTENAALKARVNRLEQQMDDAEQYSRRNCLRLANIPETNSEDSDSIVLKLADTMNISLTPIEIDRSHRIGKPGKKLHRDIIVKFTTYRARERMFTNRAKLKDSEMNGIYVNEDLTKTRSKILYEARKCVKAEQPRLMGAWSSDGKILIKDLDSKVHRITSVDDLSTYAVQGAGQRSGRETQRKTVH